ncbi:MAG: creatininase family protein [Candidatus Latescibacteria bacterium]|jgi:creatinine amidohydrolase|nr:creatininase family protein [Candidatus Latescibacterota bacterium]
MADPQWHYYHELRPDELAECRDTSPVAYWPLGLLEHHGWHLPVGFDGIKADRICVRLAERTGGVIFPTMWWGTGGGHSEFQWTHYQPEDAVTAMLVSTTNQLISFGFRVIVLLAGHYPWQGILDRHLPSIRDDHPEISLLWGTEATIGGQDLQLPGDHAAKEETSYGLALFPELVDMEAMRHGRHESGVWPTGQMPPEKNRHPGVQFDADHPLFAQFGEDARTGSAERGEDGVSRLVQYLSHDINMSLRSQEKDQPELP